jgi:hypothetical protein
MVVSAKQKGNRGRRMAKVGDRVTVTIHGPNVLSGTATISGNIVLGGSTEITSKGTIMGDLGKDWLVELDDTLFGNKRIALPKDRVV